jgi:hypothetical protein
VSAAPFFIVSSGRSGTAMLHKALAAVADVDMHHEYMVHHIQPLAVRRYLGLCEAKEAAEVLGATYGAAVHYSGKALWGDSSNKLSWLIGDLHALFPQAKFVHLVRDGRKVAGSFFHKLGDECYGDHATQILKAYAEDGAPAPPPEKKYWWPRPRQNDPGVIAFDRTDQFGRIAWHWAEINRVILNDLVALPPEQTWFVKLEDLRADQDVLRGLYDFLGLAYHPDYFAMFQRPHNVNRPEDKLLTAPQRATFTAIAGPMMERLGYAAEPEYVVNY